MATGLSLANKCQLLFGVAVVVLLGGVLAVPWFQAAALVDDTQLEIVRQLADSATDRLVAEDTRIERLNVAEAGRSTDEFVRRGLQTFTDFPERTEILERIDQDGGTRLLYLLARRVESDIVELVLVERPGAFGAGQLLTSRIFIIAAGMGAGLIAILVFYLILTKLIFSPVRALRQTTELVEQGDMLARSGIRTGDEFEQLGEALNRMLDELGRSQERLTSMNESLDFKVTELAEANIGLFESNRLKSEFLANISHELRTPLNSIIGFAELLEEMAATEGEPSEKRMRYLQNIVSSGRSLLDMINELLQMAKIEAGRVELALEPCSIADMLEGLRAIMRPQAESKSLDLQVRVPDGIDTVETDPGKLQQILYNFLSNAIRFSPEAGAILISVDRINRQDGQPGVRIGVTDEGPGVPYDMQDAVFEKFRQVDASHTRTHSGTGLGLAICRELAGLLGATVSLVSEPGSGATFSVEIPFTWQNEDLLPLIDQSRRS